MQVGSGMDVRNRLRTVISARACISCSEAPLAACADLCSEAQRSACSDSDILKPHIFKPAWLQTLSLLLMLQFLEMLLLNDADSFYVKVQVMLT